MKPMRSLFTLTITLFFSFEIFCQSLVWQTFVDSVVTLSSPRFSDLNNDGTPDIVIGGGRDGQPNTNGVMALNGIDGSEIWTYHGRDEIFGSAVFQDVSNDGIPDVFIVGRGTQLLCINGATGNLLWDYFPYNTNPADSGLYNFYNPQFIQDLTNDGIQDILIANGGNHAAAPWEERPPGHLMVINAANGNLISKAVVPDSAETYNSILVADLQNNGTKYILYGTGGEFHPGNFWVCPLNDLIQNQSLTNSVKILSDSVTGFVAPAALHKNNIGGWDFIVQAFDGRITKFNGNSLQQLWTYKIPNTESSSEVVLGNFTGNLTPDVFAILYKGSGGNYSDYYQVMIDGATGQRKFIDSIGTIHFASANAVDLNNDGRDEAVLTVTHHTGTHFQHRLHQINFVNHQVSQIGSSQTGVNIACTPLITDLDGNGNLDIIYVVKKDSIDPMGWKGFYVNRLSTNFVVPNAGVAWGTYMGNNYDGKYSLGVADCGTGSVFSGFASPTSCNGFEDGSISIALTNPSLDHTFLWSNDSLTQNLMHLSAGNYTLFATDDMGCSETATFLVTDPFAISYGNIISPSCPELEDGHVIANSSGCVCMFSTCVFTWDNGATTKNNDSARAGYNVVTILHTNGCLVTDSVWINPPAAVTASTIINDVSCYGGYNGAISLSNSGNYPITNILWSTGDTTNSIDQLAVGNYFAAITDSRGCKDTLHFEINEVVTDSAHADYIVQLINCNGGNDGLISLSIDTLYPLTSVVWSTGETDMYIDSLTAGNYSVIIQDTRFCRDTLEINLSEPDAITAILDSLPTLYGSPEGEAYIYLSGGIEPYNILWTGGMITTPQTGDSAIGLWPDYYYTATVTDAKGCLFIDSIFVPGWMSIQPVENLSKLFIYPNPTAEKLFINNLEKNTAFHIYDLRGSICLSGLWNNSYIDVSVLGKGIYYLRINTKEKEQVLKFNIE